VESAANQLPTGSTRGSELPKNVSELVTSIGDLIRRPGTCSDIAKRDLLRLLGHSLATDSPADRRQQRLGLLIELISEGGEFIPSTRYEKVRKERAAQGVDWPNAVNLTRAYGHWLVAVKAANRFWFGGGRERVSDNHHHARGTQAGYEPVKIVAALREAKIDLELPGDHWPTKWEYEEWAQIKRRLARRSGSDGAAKTGGEGATGRGDIGTRYPGLKQIRKAFGTYDEAVRAAHRNH
jgi:hypothetical protein